MELVVDKSSRLKVIELMLQWQGDISSRDLKILYDISHDTAKRMIQNYTKQYPDNITYNAHLKKHQATDSFMPKLSVCLFETYINTLEKLQFIKGEGTLSVEILLTDNHDLHNKKIQPVQNSPGKSTTPITRITHPQRQLKPELMRVIMLACQQNLRVEVDYLSLNNPDYEGRIIQPHALVHDGSRWHVRAYDEKSQSFRDFNLARFKSKALVEGNATVTPEQDADWNLIVELEVIPDTRLSLIQKECIEQEFQMHQWKLVIPCRAALINYLLLNLRIDQYRSEAVAQQIILAEDCRKKLKQYLWDS